MGPEWVAGWTESVARALSELGCTVHVFYYVQTSTAQRVNRARRWFARSLGGTYRVSPAWMRSTYWRLAGFRIAGPLVRAARAFRPDVVVVLKGEALNAQTLLRLKDATGAALASWWVDDPYAFERQCGLRNVAETLPLYDRVFIFDREYLRSLKERGIEGVQFLPCAADPLLYHPQMLSESEREAYAASVSLVGVHFESRGQVVHELLGEPGLRIWGPGWDMFLAEHLGGAADLRYRGDSLAPAEVAKVYCASLINLNTHHSQSKWGGLNTRAFEIPAAGGFQLLDHVGGLEELFEPGREVAVYEKPDQAAEIVRRYISDHGGRQRIARAGRERVMAEHTYRHRMATVLNSI